MKYSEVGRTFTPTLDMTVMYPVTFEGRYNVGAMTLSKGNSKERHVSDLPKWSLTEVFESLIPRYWPTLRFEEASAPAEQPESKDGLPQEPSDHDSCSPQGDTF